jgi:phage internal scaffolding protein
MAIYRDGAKERSDASAIHCQDYDLVTGEQIFLVQQEYKDECNLNNIISRYEAGEDMERYNSFEGRFGDFTEVMTRQEAKEFVIKGQRAFESLPARIRSRFENDVDKFLDFIEEPSNLEEAVELGLVPREVSEKTEAVSVPPITSSERIGGVSEGAEKGVIKGKLGE